MVACLWIKFDGPMGMRSDSLKWALVLAVAGCVCVGISIARAKWVIVLNGLALLLNIGPWLVLITLHLMFA